MPPYSEKAPFELKTAVAFLVFNRPETTEQVFQAIRATKPPKLLVVADGPRPDRPDDVEKCRATRAIIEQVDWPCTVLKNYSDANLGCKRRVSSGLDWVFATVDEAIILEDDCLPDPTFFHFCETLLEKYRDDERVMMISGDNFQFGRNTTPYSYYFSRYTHVWGWASWRRAWKHYDVTIAMWPEIRASGLLRQLFPRSKTARYLTYIFDRVYAGKINTWDYQWNLACWLQHAVTVLPNVNLVSNIGFSSSATHTDAGSMFARMKVEPARFPLSHPPQVIYDDGADDFTEKLMFSPPPLLMTVGRKLKQYLS